MERSPKNPLTHVARAIKEIQAREAAEVKPWHSFWYQRPAKNFPPPGTKLPEQYDGSDRLLVSCTQTDLKPREQRKRVERWCEALPSLEHVKFLWFHSKVLPEMFEAACQMPNLAGLYVDWSSIESLEPLADRSSLRYLRLGSSPGVLSLKPLATLTQLRWLELENLKRITDIADIGQLRNLIGFGLDGAEGSGHTVRTWQPLQGLTSLTWLKLGAVQVADGSLRPLGGLTQLKWLGLARRYAMEEFAWLSSRLPTTDCSWFHPFKDTSIACPDCKAEKLVFVTGKGKPKLCPTCDSSKLSKCVEEFQRAKSGAAGDN
jgi:hypothetical protein